jgi:hypothetical protein
MLLDIFVMLFRFSLLYLILSLSLVLVPLAIMAWHSPRDYAPPARPGDME